MCDIYVCVDVCECVRARKRICICVCGYVRPAEKGRYGLDGRGSAAGALTLVL